MGNFKKILEEEEGATLLEYGRSMVLRAATVVLRERDRKNMEEAIMAVRMCLEKSKHATA
jgi:hypothetical protein